MKHNENKTQQSVSDRTSNVTNPIRRSTRKSKKRLTEHAIEKKPPRKRIFLYLKLQSIVNLPPTKHIMKLKLEHGTNKITKLEDRYTLDTTINLSEFATYNPTFSITIEQDSIEDLNNISNNPLTIILYEHKRQKNLYYDEEEEAKIEEEEDDSEELDISEGDDFDEEKYPDGRPIAEGHIDLLQFFCLKRTDSVQQTYLYPLKHAQDTILISLPTCITMWQLYTLLPLLKEVNFCNLSFITFEAIYNIRTTLPELEQPMDSLFADIYFQSKAPDKLGNLQKVKLCTFRTFRETLLDRQHYNCKWETLLNPEIGNIDSVGVQTGCLLQRSQSFKKLFGTENVDFGFESIDPYEDYAIVSNTVNRYILTDELTRILVDAVAFNEQELTVEIYDKNKPNKVLLQGVIDLSIFMYPLINAIRFAIELRSPDAPPPKAATKTPSGVKANKPRNKTANKNPTGESRSMQSTVSETPKVKTTFAIVCICLLNPITDAVHRISTPSRKLTRCKLIPTKSLLNTNAEVCEDMYRQFDEQIGTLIKYIVDNHITSTLQARNFFCCQVANMINKIMKIIACNLNIRYPTKTNADFANLMTIVYKELEQRIYNVVQNCNMDKAKLCFIPVIQIEIKLRSFISVIKYMYECGNDSMGDFLLDKLSKQYPNHTSLNFYLYVYNVEKGRYEEARKYNSLSIKEKKLEGEYYSKIMQIYINYMDDLANEDTAAEALENLLEALRVFSHLFPMDSESFILLHCIYKSCGYLPGIAYTRWTYEKQYQNQAKSHNKDLMELPISVWQMYLNFDPVFKTNKAKQFYGVVKVFLKLGAYKFAEIVYLEIANENTNVEKYLMINTFKILLNSLEPKFAAKSFPADKLPRGNEIKAFNAQVNGSVDFLRDNIDGAMKNYMRILDIHDLENYHDYQLGLLRYAFHMLQTEQYEKAINAFKKSCTIDNVCLVQYFEIGKAYYRLNKYPEAVENLAKATKYAMHVPDLWGFLALINLKMGENFKALECWKYAKLNPENVIGEEVLEELNKINVHDIFQYVDKPE